jgi:glycine dehydrogenase subunit 1
MLEVIGAASIENLFDEIPAELRVQNLNKIAEAATEMEIVRFMNERAAQDAGYRCFMGAGAYEHHIPAPVWDIATRGEFYSAYTPYQAEASQGTLQLLYEYQTMMANLTGMDVSNASLYDGASALAESVLMSIRANRKIKAKRVLMPKTVNPAYRQTVRSIVSNQNIQIDELDFDPAMGRLDADNLPGNIGEFAALIIPQPNFLGQLEDVDRLTDWAHQHNAMVIAVVNPLSLALLKAPSDWGNRGADIVCGDGQPLGIPLSSGGPYFGFLCTKEEFVRQMPGRIVGRTVDLDGRPGFTLTLQAREQHIRRSKATSNICTNQGLMVTAATIHMSLLGFDGLERVASACHANSQRLLKEVCQLQGVKAAYTTPYFHEVVIKLDKPVSKVLSAMEDKKILAGYDLSKAYPALANHLLICVTETKTADDLTAYANALKSALAEI